MFKFFRETNSKLFSLGFIKLIFSILSVKNILKFNK